MNIIKKWIRSRQMEKERARRHAIKMINALTDTMGSVSELYIAKSQSKCLSCKHRYEKREFEKGGIVGQRGSESVTPATLKNLIFSQNGEAAPELLGDSAEI